MIVAVTAWIYWPVLRGAWLWDDGLEIARNPLVRNPGGWWKPWVDSTSMDYFPLKSTLQWVQWHLWGDDVLGYHLTNIGLHALAALLVWRLLRKLGVPAAFLGGLLFAVHPVAVESVAWISEFKNVLSLPLLLLAALAWISGDSEKGGAAGPPDAKGADSSYGPDGAAETRLRLATPAGAPRPTSGEFRFRSHPSCFWDKKRLLSLALFVLAMLSKSSVVMFPAVILLYCWLKRGRLGGRDLLAAVPFFLVSLALGFTTIWFQAHRAIGIAGTPAGFESRFAQAGWSILLYFRDCFLPIHLMPIYPRWGDNLPCLLRFLPWLLVAGVVRLVVAQASRLPSSKIAGGDACAAFCLGLGWFGLFLLPVLGLVPIAYLRVSPRADHLAYIPLVGLVGLAAAGIGSLNTKLRMRSEASRSEREGQTFRLFRTFLFKSYGLFVAIVLVALAVESHRYAAIFRSEQSLWSGAVERNPGAWLARNNLGKVLLEAGRPAEAAAQLQEAVRLQPDSAEAHANLGNALENAGRSPEARDEYETALKIDPGFGGAHYDLGLWFLLEGQPGDAAGEFRTALRTDPLRATAHNNLGLALFRLGRRAEAVGEYQRALALEPHLPEAHLNLGNAYFQLDRLNEAVEQYRAALRDEPDYAAAHHNLGFALERLGRFEEAKTEWDAADRLEAKH